jgi:hypothetical protein
MIEENSEEMLCNGKGRKRGENDSRANKKAQDRNKGESRIGSKSTT